MLSGLYLHLVASPGKPMAGAHTPCLLTAGSPNSSRHVQSHSRTKSRFPVIIQEQRGGAEASTREAFCTWWCYLHTALTTCTWVVPDSSQGTSKHLFVLGSIATGQGYLFLDQAFFWGEISHILQAGHNLLSLPLPSPRCWDYRHAVPHLARTMVLVLVLK